MLKTTTNAPKVEYNTLRRSKIMKKSYPIVIYKDNSVNSYYANCPAFPHVHAQANTIEEVKKMLVEAIEFYLADFPEEDVIFDTSEILTDTIFLEVTHG
jgi:predicted RNase H-like HicB family nuclease